MKITLNCMKIAAALIALSAAASCAKLDVVGTGSVRSFEKLLQRVPQLVSADDMNGGLRSADDMNGGWSLAAPDSTARFVWSKNYAQSPLHDVMLEFDAAPFIAAGLDPAKLPVQFSYYEGKLMTGAKLGGEEITYSGDDVTPLASYEALVRLKRKAVGYHGALDHYGINLGNGNLFEWAKDMDTNDKDIVFVLDPAPFIAAGTDVSKIAGWIFTKVTVDDENGKPIQVDKIVKPFDL
ncbi:MAG: hypothetical protein LBD07_00980 [Spirochaetaceae bacterium]|jgi:hypothetical protein|nr:hypothetical protein [Spirochaetaceae bacterium]